MIIRLAVNNALVHLYDTFNDDDAESANELAIVEAYIKQLEKQLYGEHHEKT